MAPALAAVIFIVGFGGGIGATYNFLSARGGYGISDGLAGIEQRQFIAQSTAGVVCDCGHPVGDAGADIRIKLSTQYDTVSTQQAQGSLNDQRIQQLLLFAARNNYNSGVRMDSVDLLTQSPDDSHVREALMYALQNDTNPGVRLKALDGLGGYTRQDERVRDEVLQALVADTNEGVRMQALHWSSR